MTLRTQNPTNPQTSSTSKVPIQITKQITVSINQETYYLWKSEALQVILSHGLHSYLKSNSKDDTLLWSKQDDIILNWLYKNLPPTIISNEEKQLFETSASLWNNLQMMYNKQSPPRPCKENKSEALDKTLPTSSKPHKKTPSKSENPIQITHRMKNTLKEEDYEANFCTWESEVICVLNGLGLEDYLGDTHDGFCKKQDDLIWDWLFFPLPTAIVCELNYKLCATSHTLWVYLHHLYSTNYFPTVRELKLQLETVKKGNATCAEYMEQIQSIGNKLEEVGCLNYLKGRQLMHCAIAGLGYEYHGFILDVMNLMNVRSISSSNPFDLNEFNTLLLKEEARLSALAQPPIVHHPGQSSQTQCTTASQPASTDNTGTEQSQVESCAGSSYPPDSSAGHNT